MIFRRTAPAPEPTTEIRLTDVAERRTERRYLSWSIDISVFAGGLWWEGSAQARRGMGTTRLPPLSLQAKKLDRLVSGLGPAYLRIGGSEADKIHYFDAPQGEPDALVLTRERWDDLHAFIRRHDLKLFFTCKYGLFRRAEHGHWNGSELEKLLRYSRGKGYAIDVFELGNELNAYWAFHGLRSQPGARRLAQDYLTFIELVKRYYPGARISGPGSAYWPRLGEAVRPLSNITPGFLQELEGELDIVDWHYYPFQSERSPVRTRRARRRNMMNPASFEYFTRYGRQLAQLRDRHQPRAALWLGESGSAQCGGQPERSDRFVSGFWWADQLGQGARLGHQVMVRQSLIGGDYGLIDRSNLKPRPDYWISWLWQQLMGDRAYAVESSNPMIRCYLHKHPSGQGCTLLLINLGDTACSPALQQLGTPGRCYCLTASRLASHRLRINGRKPSFRKGRVALDNFPALQGVQDLPPYSINFWRLESLQPNSNRSQYSTSSISTPSGS